MEDPGPCRLLCVAVSLPLADDAGFVAVEAADTAAARTHLEGQPFNAVVLAADAFPADDESAAAFALHAALIVVLATADGAMGAATAWLQRGADDVLGRDELALPSSLRRIRFAIERRRRDRAGMPAYATDPGTGLPHRQQFVEHLSQLLALREREPSPMAVLVLRLEGLSTTARPDAPADADALRRKLAVRLRAGVRSSDVVASLDGDAFAVLLGSILAVADAERVAEKLVASLVAPVSIAGIDRSIAVAVGIGSYPQDGKDADRLLRRANALAAVAPASGSAGPAAAHDASGSVRVAANDDT